MSAAWWRIVVLAVVLMATACVFPGTSGRAPAPEAPASGGDNADGAAARVSPRARELLEQARAVWDENDVCRQPSTALAWLDAALEVQPDYAEALIWRGRALGESGYAEDAFDDLTRAIRLRPSALAYAERGLIGLRLGNARGAERDVDRALRLDGNEPRAYVYRAALRFTRGQTNEACSDLAEACARGLCRPWEAAAAEGLCR